MSTKLIDAGELLARMREKYMANGLDDPGEPFWLCELENVINDMTAAEHAAPDFTPCSHGDGVIVRPDGVHELSPHVYRLTERLRNVTVEILTCEECGDVSIAWYRQNDTEEAMGND